MKKEKFNRIIQSWWVLLSFFVLFSGLGMIVAGKKVKNKKWIIFGLSYILLQFVLISLNFFDVLVIVYIASIIHTFTIRKEYFIRLDVLKELQPTISQKEKIKKDELVNKIKAEYKGKKHTTINVAKDDKENNIEKNVLDNINNKSENQEINFRAKETNLKANEHEERANINDEELVDINNCSEQKLSKLPGVGIILAKKAINIRFSNGGFKSVNEFISILDIKEYNIDKLKARITCNKIIDNNNSSRGTGRRIDI